MPRSFGIASTEVKDKAMRTVNGHVVSRGAWGASEAREPYEPVGALRALVLHHSGRRVEHLVGAGLADEAAYLRALQQRHFDRGFSDVGYHYVILPSGRVFLGRPATALGAHVKGWNTGTLGICLAGDFDLDHPTPGALRSLRYVRRVLVPSPRGLPLVSHSDLALKRCPGRFLHRHADRRPRDARGGQLRASAPVRSASALS
jgi:hypothetical protein